MKKLIKCNKIIFTIKKKLFHEQGMFCLPFLKQNIKNLFKEALLLEF